MRCEQCRLIRLEPQPTPAQLRRYYPPDYWLAPEQDLGSRLLHLYRRLVLRDHVRFVERALGDSGESGPVLDVGCGGALFLRLLRERGFRVVGLDFSLDAA